MQWNGSTLLDGCTQILILYFKNHGVQIPRINEFFRPLWINKPNSLCFDLIPLSYI